MKMAQFINFEVDVDNEESDNGKEVSDDSDLDSLKSFIDNEEVNDNDVNFYRTFNNVETDIEQTLKEEYQKGLEDIQNFDENSNFDVNSNLIEQLEEGKFKFILDLQKFDNICYEIDLILSKDNYFLRIF